MDLYKILGLEKTATKEEISKAFRELAKTHHPDVGGDGELFKAMSHAYSILTNDRAKIAYDQSGTEEPFSPVTKGIEVARSEFFRAISKYKGQAVNYDLIDEAKKEVNTQIQKARELIANADLAVNNLKKIQKRLKIKKKKKKVPEVLISALNAQIISIRQDIVRLGEDIEAFKVALEILNQYSFETETSFETKGIFGRWPQQTINGF
jgi:curved DNA-binding protein CbpA